MLCYTSPKFSRLSRLATPEKCEHTKCSQRSLRDSSTFPSTSKKKVKKTQRSDRWVGAWQSHRFVTKRRRPLYHIRFGLEHVSGPLRSRLHPQWHKSFVEEIKGLATILAIKRLSSAMVAAVRLSLPSPLPHHHTQVSENDQIGRAHV